MVLAAFIRGAYYQINSAESRQVRLLCPRATHLTLKVHISESFTPQEFAAVLKHLKAGKAPGPDSICSELITHAGAALKSWLCGFLSSCLCHLKIPSLKKSAGSGDPYIQEACRGSKSYRSISLLCIPYKILKRLIHARVEPIVDPHLPREQAGFRRERSIVDQTVLLTQNIEDSFEAKKKAGAVFVDLIAAYDTVWHRGLTCKLGFYRISTWSG